MGADVAVFEKDRTTGVTAFDAAIEIVPLIDPTDGRIRLLELVEMRKRFTARDFVEKSENAVKDAAVVGGGDEEIFATADRESGEPEAVGAKIGRRVQIRDGVLQGGDCSEENCALIGSLR